MTKTDNKPVYTPRFGSQLSLKSIRKNTVGEKSATAATEARRQPSCRQNAKDTSIAGVNLQPFSVTRGEAPATRRITPAQLNNYVSGTRSETVTEKGPILREEESGHWSTDRGPVSLIDSDAFSFSVPDGGAPSKPGDVTQVVLRTISKMLEENRAIRRRLMIRTQGKSTGTEWISYKSSLDEMQLETGVFEKSRAVV